MRFAVLNLQDCGCLCPRQRDSHSFWKSWGLGERENFRTSLEVLDCDSNDKIIKTFSYIVQFGTGIILVVL